MRRHWQHTSFCMGQCVSSCGSKRTLDSVPTTPDTENYPGLISTSTSSLRSVSKASSFALVAHEQPVPLVLSTSSDLHQQPSPQKSSRSPAAKFVTAFAQKKIIARRINPGGDSPIRIPSDPSPTSLPLKIPALLTPTPSVHQDGDMKGSSPAKNYFRETISSAKKSSSKTVTFSEATPSPPAPTPPPPSTKSTRKKHFFSFSKSNKQKDTLEAEEGSRASPLLPKGLLRKRPKPRSPSPATTARSRSPNEKHICRITLSPKQGSSKSRKSPTPELAESNDCSESTRHGGVSEEASESDHPQSSTNNDNQTMGNASSSQGNAVEVVKKFKPVVKSSSTNLIKGSNNKKGDINENITAARQTIPSSKSVESPGLIHKNYNNEGHHQSTPKKSESDVFRNLNLIKEENRLLRLKFFLEDSSDSEQGLSCSPPSEGPLFSSSDVENMNRQHFLGNKSSIPLPKSLISTTTTSKPAANTTGIPKLYSVTAGTSDNTDARHVKGPTNSRLKFPLKAADPHQQPTNLNSGKWVPAAEFFDSAVPTDASPPAPRPHSSPSTTRNNRRSSESPRWPPGNKFAKESKAPDGNADRRGTVGYQPRRFPATQHAGIPRATKTLATTSERTIIKTAVTSTKIGVRKPEETKPFYTLGLYQNRPKPVESPKPFGVLQSGFQGVSTGIVKQRAQQYQSKVSEVSSAVSATVASSSPAYSKESAVTQENEQKSHSPQTSEDSPKRPGVQRSATYTIRRHGDTAPTPPGAHGYKENTKTKSDMDSRYLTWTVRKGLRNEVPQIDGMEETMEPNVMEQSIGSDASGISSGSFQHHHHQIGYPLQHAASGASTSSMTTNEDGAGDHVAISDSEYLIDDEISDQPELTLTLTFKDSSLKLSPSSSGESLLSCDIMLDHLDHNQDRILGELTSDSAISDISTHKPTSQNSFSKLSDVVRSSIIEHPTKVLEHRSSPSETSPSSLRNVRHPNPKSPRRTAAKPLSTPVVASSHSRPVRQTSGDVSSSTGIPKFSSSSYKSPVSSSAAAGKNQRTTPETRLVTPGKPSHVRSILTGSTSLSPVHQNRVTKKENVVGLTIENVSKLHKQYEQQIGNTELKNSSSSEVVEQESSSLPVPLVTELISEFHGMKDELEKLRAQLESQERREREKDELIQRLTGEVERLKSILDDENPSKIQQRPRNGSVISPRGNETINETARNKERYLNSLNYENAAVQTENNNIFNRTVTYPDEDDKYGELVSFRIGRSSSVKKKL